MKEFVTLEAEQGAMLIYDIACQYFVHLQDQIGYLLLDRLTLDHAIGLFHVHGHKELNMQQLSF